MPNIPGVTIFNRVVIFLLSCLLLASVAHADSCRVEEKSYDDIVDIKFSLQDLMVNGCYGEAADPDLWVKNTVSTINKIGYQEYEAMRQHLLRSLDVIYADFSSESPDSVHRFNAIKSALIHLKFLLADATLTNESSTTIAPDDWKYYTRQGKYKLDGFFISLQEVIEGGCNGQGSIWRKCEQSVRKTERMLQYFNLLSSLVKRHHNYFLNITATELGLLDSRWQAYFYKARPQNFLEVGLNSYRFNKEDEYEHGESGFRSPPAHQWILLHPNLALEFVDDEVGGNKLQEALVLELLGYNRWSWKEGSAEMEHPLGFSIIATASDRASVDDFGWGVMLHYDHVYSFGVTRHGSSEGYFFSMDLMRLYTEWSDKSKNKFKKFKEKSAE